MKELLMTSRDEYDVESIFVLPFPKERQIRDGVWARDWRVATVDAPTLKASTAADVEREMSEQNYSVRIERTGPKTFVLHAVTDHKSRRMEFVYSYYRMLRVFDRRVGRIETVEGRARAEWTPFRDFSVPSKDG